jgi:hypothetical protein
MSDRLSNEQIEVEIKNPSDCSGARFDRTGFITQVRMCSGGHTFCVPESLMAGSGTGGQGLCNEFGIFSPIGYDEAGLGGCFPKIGVGLLTRLDEGEYDFRGPYPVEPFPLQVHRGDQEIQYVIHPSPCNGYALRLEKRVRIQDSSLFVEYALHNVGNKRISTHEYVHNFIAADQKPVGSDYVLKLGAPAYVDYMEPEHTKQTLDIRSKEIRWHKNPDGAFYCTLKQTAGSGSFFWELVHKPSGVGIRESGDFEPERICLWGTSHAVSPEVFVEIDVAPGEFMFWTRRYDFFVDS